MGRLAVEVNDGLWGLGRIYERQGNGLAEEWTEVGHRKGGHLSQVNEAHKTT